MIVDNLKAHKEELVRELIEARGYEKMALACVKRLLEAKSATTTEAEGL